MNQAQPDIDRAIVEFAAAVAGLFSPRGEIDRLKAKILDYQLRGLPTLILRKELLEKMAAQVMRDVAA